ncbi:MAG: LPS assembly lipoprotein LptE [Alphaproteobacteria bacterium]
MRNFFLLSLLFLLPACGFSPVYGNFSGNTYSQQDLLSYVSIDNIPDREGQYLRNVLIDRFYRHNRPANPQYILSFSPIQESVRDLDITESSDSTRGQLRLDTQVVLSDSITGEILLKRDLSAITSYNILRSEFANRVSEQNTRRNALDDLAEKIERHITLYFERQHSAP